MLMCAYITLITVISIHNHTTKFIFSVIIRMAQNTMDGVRIATVMHNTIELMYAFSYYYYHTHVV
jgi:hypothetical protein